MSIFLCFFLRMRLRRFLISDPMRVERLANRIGLAKTVALPVVVHRGRIEP